MPNRFEPADALEMLRRAWAYEAWPHALAQLESRDLGPDTAPWHDGRARWLSMFDHLTANDSTELSQLVAISLLESLAEGDEVDWIHLLEHDRLERLTLLARPDTLGIELLEQLIYAPPDLGLADAAVQRLEVIGYQLAREPEEARRVERLLHAAGQAKAAYRVERRRKSTAGLQPNAKESSPQRASLRGLRIVIAGGHPPLRQLAARLLQREGAHVWNVPPGYEANRRERDIADILRKADLVVLVVRQIPHTTSDRVRAAAGRLGVQVAVAPRASANAIYNAVQSWYDDRESPDGTLTKLP